MVFLFIFIPPFKFLIFFLRFVWFFAEPVADASAETASMLSIHWCNVEVVEGLLRIVRPTSNALSHSLSTVCWPIVFTSKLRWFLVFRLASLSAIMFCNLLKFCKMERIYKLPANDWPINKFSKNVHCLSKTCHVRVKMVWFLVSNDILKQFGILEHFMIRPVSDFYA